PASPAAGGGRRGRPLLHRVRERYCGSVVGAQEPLRDARPPATMIASGTTRELLALDAADPGVRLDRHPLWDAVLDGTLSPDRLVDLVLTFYPSLAGTARYLFSSKVSTLALEDGKAVYRQLYEALTVPDADADTGWRRLALAMGATSGQLDAILATPRPEVAD